MAKLTQIDLHFVVSHLPRDVIKLMQDYTLMLGGGFIRETIAGGTVQDIDLFGSAENTLITASKDLKGDRENSRLHRSKNALTLLTPGRLAVQFITRWAYPDAESLAQSFDFTVCQAVIFYDSSSKQWDSYTHDSFYPDLAARRLTYTHPQRDEEVGGSFLRMRKFLMRGYNIQPASMAGLISRIALSLDISKIEALAQTSGVSKEKQTAIIIEGLLREVDPFSVIDGIEMRDEHSPT